MVEKSEVQDNMDIEYGNNDKNDTADSESISEPKVKKSKIDQDNIEQNQILNSEIIDSQISKTNLESKVEKRNADTTTPKRVKSAPHDDDSVLAPEGWKRLSVQRMGGASAGKFDIYYISPLGKKLRSRKEIMTYCEKEGIEIDIEEFIFAGGKTPGRTRKTADSPTKGTPTSKNVSTPKSIPPLKAQKNSTSSKNTPISKSKDSPSVVISAKKSPVKKDNIPISPKKLDEDGKKVSKKRSSSFKVSSDGLIRAKLKPQSLWIPPKSPFNLFQESLFDKPWQLLVGTIILGKSTGGDTGGMDVLNGFLKLFPTPEVTIKANPSDIAECLSSIPNKDRVAKIIIKFSEEFLSKQWIYPKELQGIGKFGNDSYKVFCINEWKKVKSSDYLLNFYVDWLWDNHVILQIE